MKVKSGGFLKIEKLCFSILLSIHLNLLFPPIPSVFQFYFFIYFFALVSQGVLK